MTVHRRWLTLLICLDCLALRAAVVLPPVLGSHMVLQRDLAVPVWGQADPGEQVAVSFRDQRQTTVADAQGRWRVKLAPLAVGEPATLTVAGTNTLTLTDVLVGEVWLGSGQSNLDTPVNYYTGPDRVLATAAAGSYPTLRLFRSPTGGDGWYAATPARTAGFSAQLFYFGLRLQQELGVPVGLLEAAVAGSPSGPFLSQSAFDTDPDIQQAVAAAEARDPLAERLRRWEAEMVKWEKDAEAAKAAGNKPPWRAPQPTAYASIRTGSSYERLIRPLIPFGLRGVLWDQGEGGAVDGPIWQPMVMAALIRSWRADWGQGEFAWLYVQKPSGGGCALHPDNAQNRDARQFAQPPGNVPTTDWFASLRQDGYRIMRNPNTWLVLNSDLAEGVHPPIKSGYGERDLQVALGAVYGRPVEFYGPVLESLKIDGARVRVSFTHVGRGLVTPVGQKLQGFALAGADKRWRWADAAIDGRTVVLTSAEGRASPRLGGPGAPDSTQHGGIVERHDGG